MVNGSGMLVSVACKCHSGSHYRVAVSLLSHATMLRAPLKPSPIRTPVPLRILDLRGYGGFLGE